MPNQKRSARAELTFQQGSLGLAKQRPFSVLFFEHDGQALLSAAYLTRLTLAAGFMPDTMEFFRFLKIINAAMGERSFALWNVLEGYSGLCAHQNIQSCAEIVQYKGPIFSGGFRGFLGIVNSRFIRCEQSPAYTLDCIMVNGFTPFLSTKQEGNYGLMVQPIT